MKKAFIAAALIVTIIAVRMILSATFSEQVAEVFCGVSVSALFFYSIYRLSKNRSTTTN